MTPNAPALLLAADVVLAAHFLFAAFLVLGLVLIWAGHFLGWAWVRNRAFRIAHAVGTALVAAESLLGVFCPLTQWEWRLRQAARTAEATGAAQATFMAEWVGRLLYQDLPEWMFTVAYVGFAAAVGVTFWFAPPEASVPPRRSE